MIARSPVAVCALALLAGAALALGPERADAFRGGSGGHGSKPHFGGGGGFKSHARHPQHSRAHGHHHGSGHRHFHRPFVNPFYPPAAIPFYSAAYYAPYYASAGYGYAGYGYTAPAYYTPPAYYASPGYAPAPSMYEAAPTTSISISPVFYTAPAPYAGAPAYPVAPPAYAPVANGGMAAAAPPRPSVIEYPTGRQELRGDGITTPHVWVWVPNPPPPPPGTPPALASGAPAAESGHAATPGRSRLYRWTDPQGVVHLTNSLDAVPDEHRARTKRPQ